MSVVLFVKFKSYIMKYLFNIKTLVLAVFLIVVSCTPDTADIQENNEDVSSVDQFSPLQNTRKTYPGRGNR